MVRKTVMENADYKAGQVSEGQIAAALERIIDQVDRGDRVEAMNFVSGLNPIEKLAE